MSLIRKLGRGFVLPYKNIRKEIINLIAEDTSVNSVLDFGSGTLFWSEWFKEKFNYEVLAFDPLYENRPISNNKGIKTVSKLDKNIDFDIAFICDVLHHMNEKEITETLELFSNKAKYIVIKDIDAADFLGNLQNRIHDLIINHTKTTDIYSDKILTFLINKGFNVKEYSMKKLGYPHFLLCAKKQADTTD